MPFGPLRFELKPGMLFWNVSYYQKLYEDDNCQRPSQQPSYLENKPFMLISAREAFVLPDRSYEPRWILQLLIDDKVKWMLYNPRIDKIIPLSEWLESANGK